MKENHLHIYLCIYCFLCSVLLPRDLRSHLLLLSFCLGSCLWHSYSAHLPAMNSFISPYSNSIPGEHRLGSGSWWTVSTFQHHCSWVPGTNHFKDNGKLLWLLSRFSLPLWFLVAGSFLLFMLFGVHQFSICTPLSPTALGNFSAILCPFLGL